LEFVIFQNTFGKIYYHNTKKMNIKKGMCEGWCIVDVCFLILGKMKDMRRGTRPRPTLSLTSFLACGCSSGL